MNQKPSFPSLRACIGLAAMTVVAGLVLRFAMPPQPADAALLARVEAWKRLAIEMQSPDHPARKR
jgi:hypothetical protein